ncbi:TMEM175 family protein [Secundilactobacillus paracollinoides]|nr:TMEM175 family protein [Secundilactobacillus paracollinoides]
MNKGRLEAFTDAILAIIMTIMVLELHTPEGFTLAAIQNELIPLLAT